MKNLAKWVVFRSRRWSRRRDLNRVMRDKIKRLKKNGEFHKYPFAQAEPLISRYTFYEKTDSRWLDFFFSVHGRPSRTFIPLTTYYQVIEPLLNRYALVRAVADKNSYNDRFPDISTPGTLFRRIHGQFYDATYQRIDLTEQWLSLHLEGLDRVMLKPAVDSGSGKHVLKFERVGSVFKADDRVLDAAWLRGYSDDLVCQTVVTQHEYFRQFNPACNNTLRILTYRSVISDEVRILHTLLRIGRKGKYMDHDNLGGVVVGVKGSFKLNDFAFDVHGAKWDEFNGVEFAQVGPVPFVPEIHRMSLHIARRVYHGRVLALDFTVDEDGLPLLIEINCLGNGVSQYQMNNGSLFNEFTEEVLEYCQDKMGRRRYV